MSATGVAVRLARREAVRRPWRSLIVMLLVLVPVVILTGLAVMVRTNDRSLDERFSSEWGEADVVVRADAFADDDPVEVGRFPTGSRTITERRAQVRVRTIEGHRSWASVRDLPLGDPMVAGLIDTLQGRWPTGPAEVLLTEPLAQNLKLGVGDTLSLARPNDFTATVVGTARWRSSLSEPMLFVDGSAGSEGLSNVLGAAADAENAWATTVLVDLPAGAENDPALSALLRNGTLENRFFADPWHHTDSPQVTIVWSWVGGAVAFVIVGVVIAAAFAVTARRQLRLIGQLMGNGASQRTLQATLFLQGTVIGLVGALVGVGLALAGLVVFQPLVEQAINRRIDGYTVVLADLIPIIILATAAATGAALVPARSAVRTSVLQALAGRRPVGAYPNRLVAMGAMAATGGLVLLAVATTGASANQSGGSPWLFVLTGIAGAVAVILGTCAMSPAIISRLEPWAGRLRGTARLAARSLARQRSRTGAIVAAVAVVAAGAVSGATVWMTAETEVHEAWEVPDNVIILENLRSYPASSDLDGAWVTEWLPISEEWLEQIRAVAPGSELVQTRIAEVPDVTDGSSSIWASDTSPPLPAVGPHIEVYDPVHAEALGVSPEIVAAIAEHGLVYADWTYGSNTDEIGLSQALLTDGDGQVFAEVEAAPMSGPRFSFHGAAAMSAERAEEIGLRLVPGRSVMVAPERLTDAQLDELADIRDEMWSYSSGLHQGRSEDSGWEHLSMSFEHRTWKPSRMLVTAAIIGLATLFSLGVVALGLALSAAETKDERDVLAVIGARPRTLRRLAAAKAAVLAVAGMAVGVPLGFIPTYVVIRASESDARSIPAVVFPWVQVGLLVVVVPLIATLATLLASGVALRVRPVQASTMAFD